ncbi:MAG: DnaA regulatory inactivator Hda, partial [Alphaproteobacteria bacterium]|nr:DnaA regulatory inactivator Hda [Alphaproteobacteria bacterium]
CLHLLNAVGQGRGSLLVVAREAPARWPVGLPDLRTRLAALRSVGLEGPDPALARALLVKHLCDRQIALPGETLDFLVDQMDRHPSRIAALADGIEEEVTHRRTVPPRRRLLALMAGLSDDGDGAA